MKLLITGAWGDARKFIPLLKNDGHDVYFTQYEKDDLPCDPSMIEGVVCNGLFLHHDIKQFSSLKFIQLTSAGTDRVPVQYIKEKNISLFSARGVYSIPMAEHAVFSVLCFYRNYDFFRNNQKNHLWKKDYQLRELFGKKVCIIGCGSVGTECAKRFAAFGCEILGIDVLPAARQPFENIYGVENITEIAKISDIIVLCLPLTEKTEGIVDKDFLSCLKSGCVLVNISRGKIINTKDLIKAVSEKELYAALDVFDDEPLNAESPFWNMNNVLITPHNSFVGSGNAARLNKTILKGIENGTGRCQKNL